ncbi:MULTISPECIES: phosphatase PAP2 family protein [Mycolicibacterium]|uniref:phosphatase PAP2 family protein n=1 Tax=Mycolicibacterium TaxID=1866885 RepID=UPI000FA07207|nr:MULTISPECIES: phosphatase PAP2 family protein [Mycolicibacterium]RUP32349.1 MAG: phosphatase PAP2 family protein [Mycolicibacterium sp.]UCZ61133.1 PA-phosphatase [Mycolicibacterium phocaicum]
MAWWPLVGFTATIVLGLAVRSGDSELDRWFVATSHDLLGPHPYWMLLLNRVKVLVPLYLLAVGIPLWRREWRLATVTALCPVISIIGAKVLKVLFGRPWYGENLAYPSGHTTVAITVAAMLVLAIGIHPWSVTLAVIGAVIPSIGMASNGFHYFTDIIGGAFYATGMVCLAVLAAGPQALHHSRTRGASHWGSGSVRR